MMSPIGIPLRSPIGALVPSLGFNSSRLLEQQRPFLEGAAKPHFAPTRTFVREIQFKLSVRE